MADKKSLVIKVKYPTHAKTVDTTLATAKVVTVWHIQRIAWLVATIAVLVIVLCYALSDADKQVVSQTTQQSTPDATQILTAETQTIIAAKPTASAILNNNVALNSKESPRVRRAVITTAIDHKQPRDEISGKVHIKRAKPLILYFFTEVRNMNGKTIYHEWLHNGYSVAKEALLVEADRWRVSTLHRLDDNALGQWEVKLTDDQGHLLQAKSFQVSIVP